MIKKFVNWFENLVVKVWKWIIYSSANSQQIALTVRGTLYGLVPVALVIFGVTKIQVGSEDLTELIDNLSSLIVVVGGAITSIMTVYGILRKILLTILGKNKVLIAMKSSN